MATDAMPHGDWRPLSERSRQLVKSLVGINIGGRGAGAGLGLGGRRDGSAARDTTRYVSQSGVCGLFCARDYYERTITIPDKYNDDSFSCAGVNNDTDIIFRGNRRAGYTL